MEALVALNDPRAVEPLSELLRTQEHPDTGTVRALAKFADPKCVPALIPITQHRDHDIRQAAVTALGQIKAPEGFEAARLALNDQDQEVRLAAVVAVSSIGGPNAAKAIAGALSDEENKARVQAHECLVEMGEPAIDAIAEVFGDAPSQEAIGVLGRIGGNKAVAELVKVSTIPMRTGSCATRRATRS